MVLLWRHQHELSIHKKIELDLSSFACSAEERADLTSALKNFCFGHETLGLGVNDKTFNLLQKQSNNGLFIQWAQVRRGCQGLPNLPQ